MHGSLCYIDVIMIEWHHEGFNVNTHKHVDELQKMLAIAQQADDSCNFQFKSIDDESYRDSSFPLPGNNSNDTKIVRSLMVRIKKNN